MNFQNSPLFHFVTGTLWFLAAVVLWVEKRPFIGLILIGCLGVYFYARGFYLIGKARRGRKEQERVPRKEL